MQASKLAALTSSGPATVRGKMRFLKSTKQHLKLVVEGPSTGETNGLYHDASINLEDMRRIQHVAFCLDTTGFKLVKFSPSKINWDDEPQVLIVSESTCAEATQRLDHDSCYTTFTMYNSSVWDHLLLTSD
jgi:hypothetical protein